MRVLDQLKLVLLFKNVEASEAAKYVDTLESFERDFLVDPIRSLRFDNSRQEFNTLLSANSVNLDGEVAGLGMVTAAQYGVREEEPERYAFYSESYKESLFIKFFVSPKHYAAFRHNNRVQVLAEFKFRGVDLLKYRSAQSDRVRYAIFCPQDVEFDAEDFNDFPVQFQSTKTAVFSG